MKTKSFTRLIALALALAFSLLPSAFGQTTAFTYQGYLEDAGAAANGLYDFRAELYNRATPGAPGDALVSSTLTLTAVPVTNGLFMLTLDFGASPFNGEDRWLQLQVRTNGAAGYTMLLPRQPVTPTPYAIRSANLTGTLPASQLTGTLPPANLPTGGNWPLISTLTLDTSTLAVDPVNNRIGIGTVSPAWPLHLNAPQGVARLDSTASASGSVLELRNNTASPAYLGAINFNNAAGSFPGQIGYLGTNVLTFRVAGNERMKLDGDGRLDVTGPASSVALNALEGGPIFVFPQAVKATSDSVFGAAIVGSSQDGTAISGTSANGWAGSFNGAVQVSYNSPFEKPHLLLKTPTDGGFTRLRMQSGSRPFWDLAMGGDNSVRFYAEGQGDVMTLNTNGQLFVKVLTITGGADIAEPFEMSETDLPPGAVVVIDELNPGKLKLSTEPFDRRVAGVISGAGGVRPGLSLQQNGVMEGNQHVALTGRVYVQADTSNGPILPGDLLTTSHEAGHAMKVTDPARAQGAILGKAMTGLAAGRGLVLVLVTLQ